MDSFRKRKTVQDELFSSTLTSGLVDGVEFHEAYERDKSAAEKTTFVSKQTFLISFSWPGGHKSTNRNWSERKSVSRVFPGESYSFNSYSEYLAEYEGSKVATTFKKGGWDCFRHIEILAAGALPYMPDIEHAPKGAMARYPKTLMKLVKKSIQEGIIPDESATQLLSAYFREYLTSEAMATLMLKNVDFQGGDVLFLDPGLKTVPDYLSVMTLVGLKRVLGKDRVKVPFGADPVYKNWQGDSSQLHGLGFGYTAILESNFRGKEEGIEFSTSDLQQVVSSSDLTVIANVSRNRDFADYISSLDVCARSRLFIWGDDLSPSRADRKWLDSLNGFKALRELY
jgi:hypothetical protein